MQPRSIRLNNDLRAGFIKHVIEQVMPERSRPTKTSFQKANAERLYEATYGKYKEVMEQLPAWMLKPANCFFVQLGNAPDDGYRPQNIMEVISQVPVLTFYKNENLHYSEYHNPDDHSPLPILDDEHELTKAFRKHQHAMNEWGVKQSNLKSQLRELTNSCNTTGQLYKTWPKAVEYADYFPQPQVQERTKWEPQMDSSELDIGLAISGIDVDPVNEN
jgi:hypothetical protein